MARIFGEIAGIPPGTPFANRRATAEAGVHTPHMQGIAGSQTEGAESIVVSGGYEDDEDYGTTIVYTGHGGNDAATKRQVSDQQMTKGNRALAISGDRGLPVRVVRGAGGDPAHSPSSGFRYDGLFYVDQSWEEIGKSGFNICRFRLVAEPQTNATTNPPPAPPAGSATKAYASTQRLVRNTAVTEWVKRLYDYTCQVCALRLMTAVTPYAEGAHMRPVGKPHNGPDTAENVLCLCPNDHVLFDRGAIGVDASWNVVNLKTSTVLGMLTIHPQHKLSATHAAYHRRLFP
jgi:putative restriction endonuclease